MCPCPGRGSIEIAQRFIAGINLHRGLIQPPEDDSNYHSPLFSILSPARGPLRLPNPAINRWAIIKRPSGTGKRTAVPTRALAYRLASPFSAAALSFLSSRSPPSPRKQASNSLTQRELLSTRCSRRACCWMPLAAWRWSPSAARHAQLSTSVSARTEIYTCFDLASMHKAGIVWSVNLRGMRVRISSLFEAGSQRESVRWR